MNEVNADIVNYPYLIKYIGLLEKETDISKLIKIVTEIVKAQANG